MRIRMTGRQHQALQEHLLPADGREAVAVALCGRRSESSEHDLLIQSIVSIPYDRCELRDRDIVRWPTEDLRPLLEKAGKRHLGILKIHSHPTGYDAFSTVDDESDRELFPSIYGWVDDDLPHASAVMLPTGRMFARVVGAEGKFTHVEQVSVAGDDLKFWFSGHATPSGSNPERTKRHAQAFGDGTTTLLRHLRIGVVGCSGTGSLVIEQLARLDVGSLVLVDPDVIETKNLNRIVNAFAEDARKGRRKVTVLADAIARLETGARIIEIPKLLFDPEAVKVLASCDVVFGCMDKVEGRHLLNRLATFYNIPYFDVGVRLDADGKGGIDQICGTVHYLQPDGSSLVSRKAITMDQVRAEGIQRTNPAEYAKLLKSKYIVGVQEDRPAVISVNMLFASLAVNEFLARLHCFRDDANRDYARLTASLTQTRLISEADGLPCSALARHAGRGDVTPLLDMPELSGPGNGA